ncbi:IclR family transcriptional regulator [Streptomyces sp. NPDC060194]|uniref:IclR family transcriptional regulator n=1 Tax=Streptomyces sp. NPDC060194 TaxID=3347069 RepID=UPI00364C1B42
MALRPEPTTPFPSVPYALRVLESVSQHPGGVTEAHLSRETGLPSAHLVPLLLMLRREGYVEQVTGGAYVTGDSLTLLGSAAPDRQVLSDRLQASLEQLRDQVGAAIYLSRYIDGEVRITHVADGPETPAVSEWVDFRSAAHASAAGKSLLAQLDLDGRRDHLARHRPARLTSRTITDERVLLNKLAAQPPTVPFLDLQEYAVGTVCAAVPLTAGSAVGSLALSMPVQHAHRLRRAAERLNKGASPILLSLAL